MASHALGLALGVKTYGEMADTWARQEEAQRRRDEWEREQQYRRELEDAGTKAGLETRNGYRVSGDGQEFMVPTQDAARAYEKAGYSYDPTQVEYQEANAGSRSLGQFQDGDYARGMRQANDYNASRFQRMSDVATSKGKFQDAAAMEGLQNAPLTRKGLENQLALFPGQMQLQDIQLEAAKLKQQWSKARSGGLPGMMGFYDANVNDGFKSSQVKNKDGSISIYRTDADGNRTLWDTFKADKDLGLSAEQMAALKIDGLVGTDDKSILKIAELNMTRALKEAQMANTAAIYGNRHAPQVYNTEKGVVVFNPNTEKWTLNGKPAKDDEVSKLIKPGVEPKPGRSMSPKERQETIRLIRENNPNFDSMPKADQDALLATEFGGTVPQLKVGERATSGKLNPPAPTGLRSGANNPTPNIYGSEAARAARQEQLERVYYDQGSPKGDRVAAYDELRRMGAI